MRHGFHDRHGSVFMVFVGDTTTNQVARMIPRSRRHCKRRQNTDLWCRRSFRAKLSDGMFTSSLGCLPSFKSACRGVQSKPDVSVAPESTVSTPSEGRSQPQRTGKLGTKELPHGKQPYLPGKPRRTFGAGWARVHGTRPPITRQVRDHPTGAAVSILPWLSCHGNLT